LVKNLFTNGQLSGRIGFRPDYLQIGVTRLCLREGIAESLYYNWSTDCMEAGKRRLASDTARQATSSEVTSLKREALGLKIRVCNCFSAGVTHRVSSRQVVLNLTHSRQNFGDFSM